MSLRAYEELVERHVHRWQVQQHSPDSQSPPACVTFSRWPGSNASEVAKRVSDELGHHFFDIEILDRIAKEHGIRRRLLDALDERLRGTIERYVVDSFRSGNLREDSYLRYVAHTVAALGEQGAAVIVGRGAPFIIGSHRCLKVLVVSPRPLRIERMAKVHSLSPEAAARRLVHEDARRREFLAQFDVKPDDPSLYDLVVNTGTLGLDAAVDLIAAAYRDRFPRRKQEVPK